MLGSENESVRLGGIYMLRNLSEQHAEEYHLEVSRLLCAFIRHPTGFTPSETNQLETDIIPLLREDVQVALDAVCTCHELNTRLAADTLFWLDFREAELSGARLRDVNLTVEQTQLGKTFAEMLRLTGAANFRNALLRQARMEFAKFPNAEFTGADLSATRLSGADLSGARLEDADMRSANLMGADLSRALLWNANLSNAFLHETNLTGVEFAIPNNGAIRRPARGLTQSQLDCAISDPTNPPKLEGVIDAETGEQLVWKH